MAPLAGLTGLYAPDPVDTGQYMDQGVLEARAQPLSEDHGSYGSQSPGIGGIDPSSSPYFSTQGTYDGGASDEYGGTGSPFPGKPQDRTPDTHGAPWPRGIRADSYESFTGHTDAALQMTALHSQEFGGTARMVESSAVGHEEATNYTTERVAAPNETIQARLSEGQLRGALAAGGNGHQGGNADTVQGYGVLNTTEEFQAGHQIRRIQHDRMPWDFTATHGEQDVPFQGRHPVQQMPLDGPDSPFYEQGDISGANIPWEGRIGYPTVYQQPSQPTVIYPDSNSGENSDVFAWAGGF
jgi:hypothetical protein